MNDVAIDTATYYRNIISASHISITNVAILEAS